MSEHVSDQFVERVAATLGDTFHPACDVRKLITRIRQDAKQVAMLKNHIAELERQADQDAVVVGEISDDCRRLQERIAELEADIEKHRWIPVTERMPEIEETVLAYSSGGFITMADIDDFEGRLAWYSDEGLEYRNVTHWQPLPEWC